MIWPLAPAGYMSQCPWATNWTPPITVPLVWECACDWLSLLMSRWHIAWQPLPPVYDCVWMGECWLVLWLATTALFTRSPFIMFKKSTFLKDECAAVWSKFTVYALNGFLYYSAENKNKQGLINDGSNDRQQQMFIFLLNPSLFVDFTSSICDPLLLSFSIPFVQTFT